MSTNLAPTSGAPAAPALSATDLADLMRAFNDVTAKLQASHDALREQVATLTRDLGEANTQLERARRLAALGEMAAGIAHEVRNPLGGIRLYARMLEEDLVDRPGERAIARKIDGAAAALDAIVHDVLAFSKELKPREDVIEASGLFEEVLASCRHDGVPGWRGVEFIARGDATIRGDARLLKQALVNMVRNAVEAIAEHASPPPRRVVIEARRGRCVGSDGRRGPCVTLLVRDTGPGVSPEVAARMFNPFYTTRGHGTGLGLAIVHRIVDAHGGRMVVRNNADAPAPEQIETGPRGARFEVVLPQPASAVPSRSGRPGREGEAPLIEVLSPAGTPASTGATT